ncbi:hypothetical protein BDW22DRAFT_1425551 [Trametopsis cervina]|nr:hypothetical protein BDW22DRAFT_1425551 [Trametopsis cervina]
MSFVVHSLLLVLAASVAANDAHATNNPDALRVLHRIYHPSRPSEPFTDRAALILTRSAAAHHATGTGHHASGPITGAHLVPHETLLAGLSTLEQTFQSLVADLGGAHAQEVLYQLALEHPGDTHSSQWHVSSVKACHLPTSTSEHLTLHLPSTPSAPPFALDYFLAPVPHDGACPRTAAAAPEGEGEEEGEGQSAGAGAFAGVARLNSTVRVLAPRVPPLPILKTPPPLSREGAPIAPPPEKSFLQKYWVYIAVGLAALTLAPGPSEEEGQGK